MRQITGILISLLLLASCGGNSNDQNNGKNEQVSSEDSNRIAQLELENEQKDSLINASLRYFNEIRTNLETIDLKKQELQLKSKNPEISTDDKKWILEQIRHINYLREENVKKIVALNNQLKKNNLHIAELNEMIEALAKTIQLKDDQLQELSSQLASLDKAYDKLFDAYQEKAELVEDLTDELNTAYYSYGTEDELVKNQVIERRNGFIGIGKKIRISERFNEKYFAKIDQRKDNNIFVEGSELKFITDHPSFSYKLVPDGKNTRIQILNPHEFWKVSRYLVIIVE